MRIPYYGKKNEFYRLSKERFECELEAYSRCKVLQGNGIARRFGSGVLHYDSSRLIKPPFVLLEAGSASPLQGADSWRLRHCSSNAIPQGCREWRRKRVTLDDDDSHLVLPAVTL